MRFHSLPFAVVCLVCWLTPSPAVRAHDLRDGDLLVGASKGDNSKGVIWLVRGASVTSFCESPSNGSDPFFWRTPGEVIVNSDGEVIFLAQMLPENYSGSSYGLFRCRRIGEPAEMLARFPLNAEVDPNYTYPFPGETFFTVSGLHLARAARITIDDDEDNGNPRLSFGGDMYVFALGQTDAEGRLSVRIVRYVPALDEWQDGPQAVTWGYTSNPPPHDRPPAMPDMVSGGGATFSATGNAIAKHSEPLRLEARGRVGPLEFSIAVSLFGGFGVTPPDITIDDSTVPNVQGCHPDTCPPPYNMMPAQPPNYWFVPLSGVVHLAYDGLPNVTSNFGPSPGHIMRIENLDSLFQGGDDTFWCNNWLSCGIRLRKISIYPIVPHWDPVTGQGNGVESLLSTKDHGLVGTQWQTGRVLSVSGNRMVEIVSGLSNPRGLGAYPPNVGLSGLVVLIRMDASSGEAVVTDPQGRRLGVDLATLEQVNDLSIDGADSGSGDVRVWAIKNAAPGTYCLETHSAGETNYAMNVYSSDPSKPLGTRLRRTARTGSTNRFGFVLSPDGTITWRGLPLENDEDGDGDVDQEDWRMDAACLTGPAMSYESGGLPGDCTLVMDADGILPGDADRDGDIDLADLAAFQTAFSGRDTSAADRCAF